MRLTPAKRNDFMQKLYLFQCVATCKEAHVPIIQYDRASHAQISKFLYLPVVFQIIKTRE